MPELGQVVFNLPIEGTFTYEVPAETQVGVRVKAPFGKRRLVGAVIGRENGVSLGQYQLKPIDRVIDNEAVFGQAELDLAIWLSEFYLCSQGEALFAMLPGGKRERPQDEIEWDDTGIAEIQLSSHQVSAVQTLSEAGEGAFYLYGVTGSGKTEVFLRAASRIIEQGRGVIYLVPEISLVHQVVDTFAAKFSDTIAILHSSLTPSQRLKEWQRIRRGEASLVIGARSAVFAPIPDLGMVIIDEEHENSYKSGTTPRYHARQVAFHRTRNEKALLVMGSATPSVEAYHYMESGRIQRLDLPERLGGGAMPTIEVVDMKGEHGTLSGRLLEEISRVWDQGRQTILFLNRRGFSYYFFCRSCGYEMTCPHCSVSVTYHKSRERMICHYCGHSEKPVNVCPDCGSLDVGYSGFGTERIEEELKEIFPDLAVARVDTDSVRKKNTLRETLNAFRAGQIDLLLGTQMVAKGLNFPGVKLVGIVCADTGLQLPDFRALERTFSLIVQVSGRAGRSTTDGRVIVQTYRPEASVILRATSGQAREFYEEELAIRRQLKFPPFHRIVRIIVRGRIRGRVEAVAELLRQKAGVNREVELLGPVECPISMISANHRMHIIVRGDRISEVHSVVRRALSGVGRQPGVYLEIDVDPTSLL